jgi:hypothetical protein
MSYVGNEPISPVIANHLIDQQFVLKRSRLSLTTNLRISKK